MGAARLQLVLTLVAVFLTWAPGPAWPEPPPVDGTAVRGLWWNPGNPGQGLDIHRAPGSRHYTVIWYGHDTEGSPTWYLGSGALADDRLDLDMHRFEWSSEGGADSRVIGTLDIRFLDHDSARLAWALPGRTGTERIEPFRFAHGAPERTLSGLWADPEDPGWGFSIASQGPWTVVIHYHYDATGAPRWVIGQSRESGFVMRSIDPPAGDGVVRGRAVAELALGPSTNARATVATDLAAWPADTGIQRLTEPLYVDDGVPFETAAPMAMLGVDVLPMDRNTVLDDHVVITRSGTITAVGSSAATAIPQGAILVRADGRFLMPGLVDAHIHFIQGDHIENDLFTILANGVTSVRQMWGQAGILGLRDAIDAGDIIGPRFLTASPGMEGPESYWPQTIIVTNPDEARQAVMEAAAEGFDFIKVYSRLSLANYLAITDEARRQAIPVVGHVSSQVGLRQALQGHHSIEHLLGYARHATASGSSSWGATLSPERVRAIAADTVAAGVWNCPTQTVIARSPADIARIRSSRDWRLLSPDYRAWLDDPLTRPGAPSQAALDNRLFMMQALWEAGARLVVGTDSGVQYVLPGPSIFEEMAAFRAAGIPAFDTLQAATWNGARVMGRPDEFGRVAVGASADLLLLARDPRLDPEILRSPLGVMARGRWWSRQAIDERLAGIEASYAE